MTSRIGAGPWSSVALMLAATLLAACAGGAAPEDVAREYGRGVYANDASALWRLISLEDRRAKDEAAFRRQQQDLRGFTRDAVRQLASYITATPVKTTMTSERARVTLRFRLPDANAPAVRALMHDWDADRLDKLTAADRQRIAAGLEDLHRKGTLPTLEGDETMDLVREAGGWKIFLNWAGGVRVTFSAVVDPAVPLDVTVSPSSMVLARGERVRVSVKARNGGTREVTTRVSHRIDPAGDAKHLALLQCPLLLPAQLAPGAAEEYESEYMLLADAPAGVKAFTVTYRFPSGAPLAR